MGINVLIENLDGRPVEPKSQSDWQDWVSATSSRNFIAQNTLVDWLALYGNNQGFKEDTEFPDFDARTNFTDFILMQGRAFEEAVTRYLSTLVSITTISHSPSEIRSLDKAKETYQAMEEGHSVIGQGVLWDAESRTYGAPDFLIRSNVLNDLFPETLSPDETTVSAKDIGANGYHYVVVDVKFTTLDLLASGEVGNEGSTPAYKAQLFVYNRALGRLQGYCPPRAFLMGRGWRQRQKGETLRGTSCMERLGPVTMDGVVGKRSIDDLVDSAANWIRRVRAEGKDWKVLPEPSIRELWPNTGDVSDFPWHAAKSYIATTLSDLTLLWQVGPDKRDNAQAAGLKNWRDPKLTAGVLGVTGAKQAPVLQAVIEVNQATDDLVVRPEKVRAAEDEWRSVPPLEFYVDFETVSDLMDDFSSVPEKGGQTLIFMIGCGHVEDGEWRFECFIVDDLTEPSEEAIIDAWINRMQSVKERRASSHENPRIMHWSWAETGALDRNYNAAKARHPENDWPELNWFDFLQKVVRAEPVVARGAFGFGLKDIAQAMHKHGLIEISWDAGPADGLGAMVGAWWCADEATKLDVPLEQIPLMQEIVEYNEVDCKVIMEIVRYLRENH